MPPSWQEWSNGGAAIQCACQGGDLWWAHLSPGSTLPILLVHWTIKMFLAQFWQQGDLVCLMEGELPNILGLSRPCPTPVTCPVERPVSPEVFLFYRSNLDLTHHSWSQTCIAHLTSTKSILDPWHIPLLVFMALFLYLLHLPCFHPCLHSPPLVYFIDLVPFLFPPCSISECLLVTVYTPSCLTSYKYPSTSPCISSLKSTKSLLPIPGPCSLCLTGTYARGQCLTSVVVPNQSSILPELFLA